jgi:hypothetical protein
MSKKIMLERLTRLFAVRAQSRRGNQILLLVDEAQNMHEPEYQTLCNLENELDQIGFKLTVVRKQKHRQLLYVYKCPRGRGWHIGHNYEAAEASYEIESRAYYIVKSSVWVPKIK